MRVHSEGASKGTRCLVNAVLLASAAVAKIILNRPGAHKVPALLKKCRCCYELELI